jgi:hypothetical protein
VEQYFSRLGMVEAYQTTHYRLNIVKFAYRVKTACLTSAAKIYIFTPV